MAETDSKSESSSSPPPINTPNIIQYPYPPGWITPGITSSPNLPQLYPVMPHQLPPIGFTSASPPASSSQSTMVPHQTKGRRTRSSQSKTKKAPAQKKKTPSHWLTTGENYDMWRKGEMSKREVAEKIVEYLVHNGIEGRGWEGVEQQVRHLEGKFWDALRWKMQTGEGIMEAARKKDNAARRERDREQEVQRELGINDPDDDEAAEDFVGAATNETEAAIKKICPFFFDLESVFMDRASAVPLHSAKSGVADDPSQIREALRLNNAEGGDSDGDLDIEPETQPPSSQPLRYDVPSSTQPPSSQPLRSVPSSALSPGMSASARSSASLKRVRSDAENSGNTPAKKSNTERITERIFPSKEEMDAQRTKDQSLARERLENDKRLVKVTAQVAESLKPPTASSEVQSVQIRKNELDLAIQSYDFELRKGAKDLERKQFEMNFTKAASELAAVNLRADTEKINLQKAQAELPKAEVEAEQAKAHSQALTRAKMIQDFLRAGVSLADAIATTTQLLEMPK
ncbi:hypothetical protein Pst134EA_018951 [Puccinia striiformis f. sp. tritici]|uniref:hypothetical protein n=1 Tax=Puccinia striiformis f. sp. tritici TaxID=168172 RepID=UPI0020078A1A|nr:hypothetical protein Pst134EA_018951 [Puccinia striiformis f. sp. tritici]KAH9458795.1 hypothetical protein Pst134EA_018951 [Puccinia striiformis f. sp. tritici]